MDQGVIITFRSSYLRKTSRNFKKNLNLWLSESDSSDGFRKRHLNNFWKGFTILDAIENICDSWEDIKIHRSLEEADYNPPASFEEFNTSIEEVNADVMEIGRELELESENETEFLQFHVKTWVDE